MTYFCYNGIAAFVLKNFDNLIYSTVEKGDFLGLIDLIPSKKERQIESYTSLKRKFTV